MAEANVYDVARAAVLDGVRRAGRGLEATVIHRTTVYDPVEDTETATETRFVAPCVKVPLGAGDVSPALDALTLNEKAKVIIPVGFGTPRINDEMTIGTDPERWTIVDLPPVEPDGAPVVFKCFVRRGGA